LFPQVLKALKRLLTDDLSLRHVVMDYEAAVCKATERVFPRAGRRGCYFHFTQAIWQKIQVLGSLQFIFTACDTNMLTCI